MLLLQEKNLFLAVNANPSPLQQVICIYLIKAGGLSFYVLAEEFAKLNIGIFDH
jgi:hypothetical protein